MKKLYSLKCFSILLLTVSISATLQAQNFKLIDVNKAKSSDPNNNQFSTKNVFAELNGNFYFQAEDGINGVELYASNGTTEGTRLVKDINPGTASSYPSDIVVSAGRIYFAATDNTGNQHLWISDGTSAGTQLLDILPSANNFSTLQYLTDVNGTLYFIYTYIDNTSLLYYQIWKTNGTAAGTVLLGNLEGPGNQLMNVNGRLFFTTAKYFDGTGTELYTSDGTEAGTAIVADINPNPYTGSNPTHLTAVNGLVYFAADDGTGNKLWVSDGSASGTHAVRNGNNIFLAPGDGYQTDPFTIKDKTLFFQGYAINSTTLATTGNELCKYNTSDTTLYHVTLVKDIIPGEKSSYPSFITNVNGTLFFTIGPDNADAQLWKSDGTSTGTVLVKNINPGGINNYYGLTNMGGVLLFAYGNNASGTELWKSNGTNAGTAIVKDILPGAYSSYPGYFTYQKGIFIFSADGLKGRELWRSNGTEAGTILIKNINDITTASSYPSGFTATADSKIIFTANDGRNPGNLFVTDGTDANTKWIGSDVTQQHLYNSNQDFVTVKNTTYFLDWSNRLWKTNGTKAGTSMLPIPAFADNLTGFITNFAVTNDLLYIFSYDYTTGRTIMWRSDGTAAGTFILKSDLPYYFNVYPTPVGKTLFFAGNDSNTGFNALWKTDGTSAGTVLVKTTDYNPLANLYNFNGKLYFSAYSPVNSYGPSLWTSDGTGAGTKVVKAVALLQQPFAQANGKLFFYALDAITKGYELFASDGTPAGTKIVKDINKDGASSNVYLYPSPLISGDQQLYFVADDGKNGAELWKSDGTTTGTKLVKNITPGTDGTSFNSMVNINDYLFFTIKDTLWQSDGLKVNTHPVADVNLKGVTQITNLTRIGDSLYFSGYTYTYGKELYAGSADINSAPVITLSIPDSIVKYAAPATIKLNAAANDEDGNISKVEFYKGTALLGTEYVVPYGFLWKNVAVGTYTLTAKAYDNKGATTVSNQIRVTVVAGNVPPIVSIVNPVDQARFEGPADIRLLAKAIDANDAIAKVEFYHGATLIKRQTSYPYACTWSNIKAGVYTITAKATDAKGLSATSAPVTFTVTAPVAPIVSNRPSPVNSKAGLDSDISLRLSPNPAGKTLQVYTTGFPKMVSSKIVVISSSGVAIKTVQSGNLNQAVQLDISSLASGSYIIKVISGDKVMYKQFIKL